MWSQPRRKMQHCARWYPMMWQRSSQLNVISIYVCVWVSSVFVSYHSYVSPKSNLINYTVWVSLKQDKEHKGIPQKKFFLALYLQLRRPQRKNNQKMLVLGYMVLSLLVDGQSSIQYSVVNDYTNDGREFEATQTLETAGRPFIDIVAEAAENDETFRWIFLNPRWRNFCGIDLYQTSLWMCSSFASCL